MKVATAAPESSTAVGHVPAADIHPDDANAAEVGRRKRLRYLTGFPIARGLPYVIVALVAVEEGAYARSVDQFLAICALLAAFLTGYWLSLRLSNILAFIGSSFVAVMAAICVMIAGAMPGYGSILLFVLCPLLVRRLSVRAAIAVAVVGTATMISSQFAHGITYRDLVVDILNLSIGFFAFIALSVTYIRSLQAQAESEELLLELTAAQGRMRDTAILEERERLAREMHDAVGHRLTVVSVLLEGAGRLIATEPERAAEMIETSRAQVKQGLDEVRAAVRGLPVWESENRSIGPILRALVDLYVQATGVEVSCSVREGIPEPDRARKLVIIRTAQEALTNVQKHARATRIELSLEEHGGAYRLRCLDNGRGISAPHAGDPAIGGFGLGNLRVRAAVFGGSIDVAEQPSGGVALTLVLPAAADD